MPTIKNVMNGGLAEVDADTAAKLVESGQWAEVNSDAPVKKSAPQKAAPRKAAGA